MYLRTLGPLALTRDDGREVTTVLSRSKRLALLVYLAVSPGAYRRRDTVLGVFWPEFDQERARGALRKAIHYLRTELGNGVIIARGYEEIGVDLDRLSCDANDFETAVQQGDLEAALALYAGDFMEGFFVGDAPDVEEWIEQRRAELRDRAADAARQLTTRNKEGGDLPTAVRWARQVTMLDPHDEAGVRQFVELLAAQGDRGGAVHAYESFVERFAKLGLEPSAETRALIKAIRIGRGQPRAAPPAEAAERVSPARLDEQLALTKMAVRRGARARNRELTRWMVAGAAAGVVLIVAGVVPRLVDREVTLHPDRVVVVPFENQTGDSSLNALGGFAAEWIAQGLHKTPALEAVPSNIVARIRGYIEREIDERVAVDPVRVFSRETGAGLVVMGSYYLVGDSLQAQVQIIDGESGDLVSAPAPVLASRHDPHRVVGELRSRVMGVLSLRVQANWQDLVYQGSEAPTWEAFQEADAGMKAFHSGRPSEAIPHLERAAAMDSGQLGSWALGVLGNSYRNLGADAGDGDTSRLAKADSIFSILDARRASLPAYQITFMDMTKALIRGDYLGALRVAREAARQYPRSLAPFGAGYDAKLGRRPREAAYWFESVVPDAPAVENWPYYWGHFWGTYHILGDHERELDVMRRYRERYPNVPPRFEIRPRAATGERDAVFALLDEVYDDGLRSFVIWSVRAWAELHAHGYPTHAEAVLAAALERYRTDPEDAKSEDLQRRLVEAQGNWAEARRIAVKLGPRPRFIDSLNFRGEIAVLEARIGNREAAMEVSRHFRAADSPYMLGRGTMWRARIAAVLGDREEAVALVRQAFKEGYWFTPALHVDRAFESLRNDPAFQDAVRPLDDDWQPPGASRDRFLIALIGAGLLLAVLAWYLGRARFPTSIPARRD